jgi:hypothetical protein
VSDVRTKEEIRQSLARKESQRPAVNVPDARTRAEVARFQAEEAPNRTVTQDEMTRLWNESAAGEKERHRQAIAAREERERIAEESRRKTEAEHAERRRLAELRDREYLAQRDIALSIAKQMLAERIEADLVTSQAAMVLESMNATVEESQEVARRLRSQGLGRMPDAYRWELEKLRSEK